jgi:glucans biosynthesis protein C
VDTKLVKPDQQDAAVTAPRSRSRLDFVDAVRILLIMLVIAHHSVEPYVTAHPPEIPLPDPPYTHGGVFLWVNATFFMGLFFFLAGYFTPGALDRKGVGTFAGDRVLRLGVPLVLGTILIAPLAGWAHIALDPSLPSVSYWTYLTRDFFGIGPKPDYWPQGVRWPAFSFEYLWFIENLLVYSLIYAALRLIIPKDEGTMFRDPPSHAAIAAYAILLAAASFVVRIWYPQNHWIFLLGFIQMEPAHLPQYASLFAIGLFAGPRRWLETMPARRGLVWLAIGVVLAIIAYVFVGSGMVTTGGAEGSRHWRVCTYEAFLCAGFCVGLPVLCRELALGTGRLWRAMAPDVFAVYVFHFAVVLLLQWALIDAPMPKLVRLFATVIGAIIGSFALTHFVIMRLPFARRVF